MTTPDSHYIAFRTLAIRACLGLAVFWAFGQPAKAVESYHIGLDFIDSSTASPAGFIFDFEPFLLTDPSNNFVTQGAFAGWTEDDARRGVALAVEDAYRAIDVGIPNRIVRVNFSVGPAPLGVNGIRMNIALAEPASPLGLLGETATTFQNPLSEDNYVAAAYLSDIDGLGSGLVTYDTAEGAINSIAGTTAHEIGHVFLANHVAVAPGDPEPLALMAIFSTGLDWEDRLVERRFSTTLPAVESNAQVLTSNISTALKVDINLDDLVNAIDASPMFANWGLEDRLHYEGDVSGDHRIDAIDAGDMFGAWTGDPGPAGAGEAIAEYDYQTGEIIVSVDGVNNWFVQSASLSLTGDAPSHAPLIAGSLASDNNEIVGETAFGLGSGQDISLGFVAEIGLQLGDLTISSNAGLGAPLVTLDVVYVNVPEPATLALAALSLCGVLATRRRRAA